MTDEVTKDQLIKFLGKESYEMYESFMLQSNLSLFLNIIADRLNKLEERLNKLEEKKND